MSRMSELAEELAELRHCGEVLISISETLSQMFSSTENTQSEQSVNEPEQEKIAAPAAKTEAPKPLTLEEVRPILAEKSRAGHTAAIRELLKKHGSPNLSGIDPAKYPALLAEVEAL